MNDIEHFETGGEIVKFEGLQHKTIEQITEERKFKDQLVKKLKKGKYGEGADFGEAGGVKGMVFLEAIEEIANAFYLIAGEPKPTVIDRTIEVEINGELKTVPHFAVRVKVPLYDLKSGINVGWGTGRCSTLESKYRYTTETLKCPSCGKDSIFVNKFKGKKDRRGKISNHQWYCWKDRGGCGAQFMENDEALSKQEAGKAERTNPDDVADTVEFMAEKRAYVKGILKLTGMRRHLKIPDELKDKGSENDSEESKQRENRKEQTKKEEFPEGPKEENEEEVAEGISTAMIDSLGKTLTAELTDPKGFLSSVTGGKIKNANEIVTSEAPMETYKKITNALAKQMGL